MIIILHKKFMKANQIVNLRIIEEKIERIYKNKRTHKKQSKVKGEEDIYREIYLHYIAYREKIYESSPKTKQNKKNNKEKT